MPGDAVLEIGDAFQRRVPPRLEFARDEPLGRIDNLVAACGEGGAVTGFLEFPAQRLPDLVIGLRRLVGGLDRGFDGVFRDGFDDLRCHGAIDADTSHANAKQPHDVTTVTPALVAVGMARFCPVQHSHGPAATAAAHQARQQRPTPARRLTISAGQHMGILRDQLLVCLVLLPADVSGVVITQQDIPPGHRLRVASGLAGASVDDASTLGCAAEDIGAGIDRVPEDLQHCMVGRRPPFDFARAAVIASDDW